MASLDPLHIESNGGNGAMTKSKDLAREASIMNATMVLDPLYGKLSTLKNENQPWFGGL